MADQSVNATAETERDFGPDPQGAVKRWIAEIDLYEKEVKDWRERSEKITKIYRDDRPEARGGRKFALLWSNVETLKPSLYARQPKADVQRRFKDQDPVARVASEVAERALDYYIDCDGKYDVTIKGCVEDLLLPGMGISWNRYVPTINEAEEVEYEDVIEDYIDPRDFGRTAGARTWAEVDAVWRRVYMTRAEMVERFGKKLGEKVPLDWTPKGLKEDDPNIALFQKACIYEVWCKSKGTVYWIHKGFGESPVDVRDDPLGLSDFFPCPRPMMATTTNNSLVPVPDYALYQDQAEEINDLTGRIEVIERAIKVRGFYPENVKEIATLLTDADNLDMVPINPGVLAALGGLKLQDAIFFWPIDMLANALKVLVEMRKLLIDDVYQITGISDILRGSTEASETATAQALKAQWGSIRIRDRQQEVARYCRDTLRIKFEVIFNHFSDDSIRKITSADLIPEVAENIKAIQAHQQQAAQMQQQQAMMAMQSMGQPMPQQQPMPPPPPDVFGQAMKLLRDKALRHFRVDIETDSTVQPDENAEKQARNEAMTAMGGYIANVAPIVGQAPYMAPFVGESLKWWMRAYKTASTLEPVIDQMVEEMKKMAQQPPPPDPEVEKMKMEAEAKKEEMAMKREAHGMDLEAKKAEIGMEMEARQQEIGMEAEAKRAELEMNMQGKVMDAQVNQQVAGQQMEQSAAEHAQSMAQQEQAGALKLEQQAAAAKAKPKPGAK